MGIGVEIIKPEVEDKKVMQVEADSKSWTIADALEKYNARG